MKSMPHIYCYCYTAVYKSTKLHLNMINQMKNFHSKLVCLKNFSEIFRLCSQKVFFWKISKNSDIKFSVYIWSFFFFRKN